MSAETLIKLLKSHIEFHKLLFGGQAEPDTDKKKAHSHTILKFVDKSLQNYPELSPGDAFQMLQLVQGALLTNEESQRIGYLLADKINAEGRPAAPAETIVPFGPCGSASTGNTVPAELGPAAPARGTVPQPLHEQDGKPRKQFHTGFGDYLMHWEWNILIDKDASIDANIRTVVGSVIRLRILWMQETVTPML